MEIQEDDQWVCPSFNTYSSNTLANIGSQDYDNEGDFEFSLVRYHDLEAFGEDASQFFEGQSQRTTFPVFNRDVLNNLGSLEVDEIIGVSLEKLLIEERHQGREEAPSSSDEETEEELDIPCRTYCIWKSSKGVDQSPNRCNKSKSTGFGSSRFRLRDLLRRSNSEGKDSFLFLTSKRNKVKQEGSDKNNNDNMGTENAKGKTVIKGEKDEARSSYLWSPSRGKFNSKDNKMGRRRSSKGDEMPKRKTYLPYRQDLVGFFTSSNSFGRNKTFPPF